MTDLQRTARVAELQSYLRNQPRLKLEFLADMSKLFRDHQIDLPHEVLASLTLTLDRTRSNGKNTNGHHAEGNDGNTQMEVDEFPPPKPTPSSDDEFPPPKPTPSSDDEFPPPKPTPSFDEFPPPKPTPST